MRLVLRVLFFEFALSWVAVIAGWVHLAMRVGPFATNTLQAGFRRLWTDPLVTRGVAYVLDQVVVLVLFFLVTSLLVETARAVI
jgi:hypothetical protein